MKWLVVESGFDQVSAKNLSEFNGCVGWCTGVPLSWNHQFIEMGWTLPCVVTQNQETGEIESWSPALVPV